jgi:RimJ/RimL family protein N-acetyltransferase
MNRSVESEHVQARKSRDSGDWRGSPPILSGDRVTLRELIASDAQFLVAMLSTEEVSRFIDPAPENVRDFEQFIAWTQRERAAGRHMCFGLIPAGEREPVGIIQIWRLDPSFGTAEWGFVVGAPYWGTGLFIEAAGLVLDFVFGRVGVRRVEGRAAAPNGRGNGALRKLGAVSEGVLRKCFPCHGQELDHVMWSILADDWREWKAQSRRLDADRKWVS